MTSRVSNDGRHPPIISSGTEYYWDGNSDQYKQTGVFMDTRECSTWYATDRTNKVIVWSGDSTTEQLAGLGIINYDGSWALKSYTKNIPTTVKMFNYGLNGALLRDFVSNALGALNSGPLNCNLSTVAALKADCYVLSWGINDIRQAGTGYVDGSIAGQAYGSAAQIALTTKLRTYFNTAIMAIKAANPDACIIFRTPNAHITGGNLIIGAGGLTAQNCMDQYRLLYRGDKALGIQPLNEIYDNVTMVDCLDLLYGANAPVTSHPMIEAMPVGLHPISTAYFEIVRATLAPLNQEDVETISNNNIAKRYTNREISLGRSSLLPLNLDELVYSEQYNEVAAGQVLFNSSSRIDFTFFAFPDTQLSASQKAYGGTTGAFGGTIAPTIGFGDILCIVNPNGTTVMVPFLVAPTDISGVSLRWYTSNSPDGNGATFPTLQITGNQNTPVRVFRHKYANSMAARILDTRASLNGYDGGPTYLKKYLAYVKTKGANNLLLQAISNPGPGFSDLSAHTLLVTDVLCLLGVDDAVGGLVLTGATLTTTAIPGEKNIALTNPNLATAGWGQCIIFSNT
jgi:hypothetical protein